MWHPKDGHPQLLALRHAGVATSAVDEPPRALAERLLSTATDGAVVVWLLDPAGDPALSKAITEALTVRAAEGTGATPELELLAGSYDLPGAHLLDLVAVMDRLRSPGGCPWDAEQTHESLVRYLVEEAYELVEAIEGGDREHLREELGDVLLQVIFHARMATEHADDPFDVDDIADGIVAAMASPAGLHADFNISAAEELTVAEIARIVWEACGREPEAFALERRPSFTVDVQRRWPSVEKAREQLGWEARIGAHAGIAQTVDWLRARVAVR